MSLLRRKISISMYKKIIHKMHRMRDEIAGSIIEKQVSKADFEYGLARQNRENEYIVVSMASYVMRYSTIVNTLKSLLIQTYKPNRIVVWLDEDNIDNQPTAEMKGLEKYGVEYRFTSDGLCAHKKYLYAMQEFSNACIITVDDDLVYSPDMIESLMKYHRLYPNEVCARRTHRITFDDNGAINSYIDWNYEYQKAGEPAYDLFATGGGGTLYPPYCLSKSAFDIATIKKHCLSADDIWLKVMELMVNRKVVWVKNNYVMPKETENSQLAALKTINVQEGYNDVYFKKLLDLYPMAKSTLLKRI